VLVCGDDGWFYICCLVASLLSCLYQLKAENRTLEERIATMTARRDRLLAVNARLSVPLASPGGANSHDPPDTQQVSSLDNGILLDDQSRHGRSPHLTAAAAATAAQQQPNYTNLRVCCQSLHHLYSLLFRGPCFIPRPYTHQHHSNLSTAATSASSQLCSILHRSFWATLLLFVLGRPGPLLKP